MTGVCKFCGQVVEIGDYECLPEERKDEAASACCGCAGSRAYAARKRKIDSAAKNVRKVAEEESISDNMHDMLDTMSASLVDYEAEQCFIRFPDFTLKMKRNNDGNVVIEKTRTQKRIYL